MGWWVGGSFRKFYHFVAPSCKLELARFSAWLIIKDGAKCGNKLISSRVKAVPTPELNSIHKCILVQNCWSKKCWVQKFFGSNIFWVQIHFGFMKLGVSKILDKKRFNKILIQNNRVPNLFCFTIFGPK